MSHSSVQYEGIRATTIELSWIELSRFKRKNGRAGIGARERDERKAGVWRPLPSSPRLTPSRE